MCGTADNLAQLLYEIPDAVEKQYEEWKTSVDSYSQVKTDFEQGLAMVNDVKSKSENELKIVEQVKQTLNVRENEETILGEEQRKRIDNRISGNHFLPWCQMGIN